MINVREIKEKNTARILLWDLETAPHVVYTWSLYPESISHDNIIEEGFIISGAWKWLGEKKIHSVSVLNDQPRFKKNHKDDYHVVKTLHDVLSKADIIIAQNGDKFDWKTFQYRCAKHNLPAPKKPQSIDTLKTLRNEFKAPSNKLDFIGQAFEIGQKVETPKGLWKQATEGDEKAIREMVVYNRGDIILLENLYNRIRPYIRNHPNLNLYRVGVEHKGCKSCPDGGSLKRSGYHYTTSGKYQAYRCKCGAWNRSKVNLKATEIR